MEHRVQERLMALTRDNTAEVRGAAAFAFGEAGSKQTVIIDKLLELTHDNTAEVRAEAAKALGRISSK
jgi:HEAT repeat protein